MAVNQTQNCFFKPRFKLSLNLKGEASSIRKKSSKPYKRQTAPQRCLKSERSRSEGGAGWPPLSAGVPRRPCTGGQGQGAEPGHPGLPVGLPGPWPLPDRSVLTKGPHTVDICCMPAEGGPSGPQRPLRIRHDIGTYFAASPRESRGTVCVKGCATKCRFPLIKGSRGSLRERKEAWPLTRKLWPTEKYPKGGGAPGA